LLDFLSEYRSPNFAISCDYGHFGRTLYRQLITKREQILGEPSFRWAKGNAPPPKMPGFVPQSDVYAEENHGESAFGQFDRHFKASISEIQLRLVMVVFYYFIVLSQ